MAGVMESTPVLLQWLASTRPPTFLSLSLASWCLLGSVGELFFKFPQAHAYPAMLSLALKIVPITNTYIAMQPTPSRHAANSSSSQPSFEALQRTAAQCNCWFGIRLLHLMSLETLHATMSPAAKGLRRQLLVGPGTQAALLRVTAACGSLHLQHTTRQKERSCRSADMGTTGASSHSHSRSNKPRGGSSASCSSSSQSSNSSAGRSAQDEAADLLLPPDHQLMVAQFGVPSVAALEVGMKAERGHMAFANIWWCVDVLRESADTRWPPGQPVGANGVFLEPEGTLAALHASVEPFCLGSAAGLQVLLEVIGLLVAEGDRTGGMQSQAYLLLLHSIAGATEAERRVFLAARGGLLVQVLRLGLQAEWEREQRQQLEGVVKPHKCARATNISNIMGMLVVGNPAVLHERADGERVCYHTFSAPSHYAVSKPACIIKLPGSKTLTAT